MTVNMEDIKACFIDLLDGNTEERCRKIYQPSISGENPHE